MRAPVPDLWVSRGARQSRQRSCLGHPEEALLWAKRCQAGLTPPLNLGKKRDCRREERRLWAVGERWVLSRRDVVIFDFIVSGLDRRQFRAGKKEERRRGKKKKAFFIGVTQGRHKGWGKRGRLVGGTRIVRLLKRPSPREAGWGDARRCRPEATPTGVVGGETRRKKNKGKVSHREERRLRAVGESRASSRRDVAIFRFPRLRCGLRRISGREKRKKKRFLSRSPRAGIRAGANEAGSLAGRGRGPGGADRAVA